MPPVPQHILNWLYSVLTSEYHDVNRTYGDVAQVLAQYPSLAPRTDVHTFENGTSALLMHLTGTLPVVFRGNTYRFPISVRLPYAYPREPPLVYVTPTESMMVRPGQHVDPQGQIYHPYLAGWPTFWDKSSILDFLAILRDVFAKEPPVIARPPAQTSPPAPSTPQQVQTPPPLPPPPRELAGSVSQTQSPPPQPGPPRPPPKPTAQASSHDATPAGHGPSGAPPRPPLPPGHQSGPPVPARPPSQAPSRYESAPPLPPQQQPPQQYQPPQHSQHPQHSQYPQHHQQSPPPPFQAGPPGPSPHVTNFLQRQQPQARPAPPSPSSYDPRRVSGPPPGWQPSPQHQQLQQFQPQPQPPKPKSPPPPNLLDEPLTLDIPSANLPAPPIPPNPEKDMLLRQLAQTLHSLRQRSRQQDEASLAGLQAQRTAMINASNALQSEMATLSQTSALLSSNAGILHDALRKADSAIEGSRRQTAPDIDELLVAPTVVANQLYTLVAEERAMGDAIFVLGRAVERGRISPAVFAKTTRSLAREWYLKKALARKIARGMGLTA